MNRKTAMVTRAQAEYGLLYWIITGIYDDPDLERNLIATGMPLTNEL